MLARIRKRIHVAFPVCPRLETCPTGESSRGGVHPACQRVPEAACASAIWVGQSRFRLVQREEGFGIAIPGDVLAKFWITSERLAPTPRAPSAWRLTMRWDSLPETVAGRKNRWATTPDGQ